MHEATYRERDPHIPRVIDHLSLRGTRRGQLHAENEPSVNVEVVGLICIAELPRDVMPAGVAYEAPAEGSVPPLIRNRFSRQQVTARIVVPIAASQAAHEARTRCEAIFPFDPPSP